MRYLVLLLLLTVACGTVPTPTPAAPLTFTGTGTTDSARFVLPAGDYRVQWTAGGADCQFGALLVGGDTTLPPQLGFTDPTNPVRWNGLTAGAYYWKVSSRCPWTLLIEPSH